MMDDLVGKVSFMQLLMLNVTGRLPERRLADVTEAAFNCVSWPDARIWCNQIGSLAGTARASSVAGICAGVLASDSLMYGGGSLIPAAKFIVSALNKKKQGRSTKKIIAAQAKRPGSKPMIVGYARPLATGDERVVAMKRVIADMGFPVGEHLALAYEVQDLLIEQYNESMNITGFVTAFFSDQGLSIEEIYRLFSASVMSGVHACYAEAADQPASAFFSLKCSDMDYQGVKEREVPKHE
ncbi:MAG: hypothetical protein GXP18_13160, partial [Gammaproteobacteria bacterium]|nr:hypothetical protein [Gammaproteobacteria bacterium]